MCTMCVEKITQKLTLFMSREEEKYCGAIEKVTTSGTYRASREALNLTNRFLFIAKDLVGTYCIANFNEKLSQSKMRI